MEKLKMTVHAAGATPTDKDLSEASVPARPPLGQLERGEHLLTFHLPPDFGEEPCRQVFQLWTNGDKTQVLVAGCGFIEDDRSLRDIALLSLQKVKDKGAKIMEITEFPSESDSGHEMYVHRFTASLRNGDSFLRDCRYLRCEGVWFSLEAMAQGENLDIPAIEAEWQPMLATMKVSKRPEAGK